MSGEARVSVVTWDGHAEVLLGIRYRVFVDEQGVPAELEHDAHDSIAVHLLAVGADGAPLGTARLLPDGHIGRMAVLGEFRGRGVGTALLRAAVELAERRGDPLVKLNAQCSAVGFYARLGFTAEGDEFLDAGIPHRQMTRELNPP